MGQTPPPFHGQAVVTGMLFDHDWGELRVERLRMAYSDSMSDVGKAGVGKLVHLLVLIWKTWMIVLRSRPRVIYYLPASPNLAPVVRDILYLGAVRWLFPMTVFHYHAGGLNQFVKARGWLRVFAKWVYGRADVSVDVNVTNPPSGAYFDAKDNTVVMNGLNVGSTKAQEKKSTLFRVLYLGLLCEPKGLLDLVETAKRIKEEGRSCQFVMIGAWESDTFQQQMEQAIDEARVNEMFDFQGTKHGDAKWLAYADADAFIFPTHHPTETFGLVLLEAMAKALPIVTTHWRGVPHVVGKDGAACLCDAHAPAQYAEALLSLMDDPAMRKQMGEAAKARYESRFTQERFLDSMEKVFREVLKS